MNKTIFITGTSSGMGKATVEHFASAGWNIAATLRDTSVHERLFKHLKNVTLYELEVTDFEQVEKIAQSAIKKFGKIDVVVNNAGYCLMGPTETSSMEQIKKQYETNVFGVFAVTKAFIPHFRDNKDGMFINIASSSAQFNYPYIAAYGSSKWAVRGMTESLGIELAPFNIEVKAIYPGTHATKIFTKLDDGTGISKSVFQHYKTNYKNFFAAQASLPNVTSPDNIAKEIYKAVTDRKGPLHSVSGGDAKLFAFLKKVLSQRAFQKLQIRSIMQAPSPSEISFIKWLMGRNVARLEVGIDKNLLEE
jgi:NAD(P)-dependent dehydrogenase (short-subunit alcohol dehydrogenase family)